MTSETSHPSESPDRQSDSIGLIGIGLMGTVVAERLIHAGKFVCGWDRDPARCLALDAIGGQVALDCPAIMSRCERVILSLPSHETVAEVLRSCDEELR